MIDDVEARVRGAVADLRVDGQIVDVVECDPALADTAAFCAAYGYDLDESANAIVVVGKSDPPVYAMCVVLASTRLDVNRTVRKRLGTKKASFASTDVTTEITGMTMGGVTPFARPPGLPLWIDGRVMKRGRIVVGGGSRGCKVVGPPAMLLGAGGAIEVIDELAVQIES